ncbi:hypothetical protein OH76DRAFT_1370055 [Lentinus brumalis]|uniref:RING-Gid-type domain-containing protein n=1 Tax=Lentinus brumalis TaxID=2498619 RepID=A0A371DWK8_9APHY|nr:hypothetical protein OH76DRAFT_1370055 [Polyporus brumalis]
MDGPLKELTRLEKLAAGASAGKGKAPSVNQSLDVLLDALRSARERFIAGTGSQANLVALAKLVEDKKKEVDDRQKELYNATVKVGKALDKKFTNPLPSYEPLFQSPEAKAALERTIAIHFLRTGQFDTAETFISESDISIPSEMREQFLDLHRIMITLKNGDISLALEWTHAHREFLHKRSSSLEFHLHRSQYLRLVLSEPPNVPEALSYAQTHLSPFFAHHEPELRRLMACLVWLPASRLLEKSPYPDLANPCVHTDLQGMFATEYCASLGMSRQAPLRVIGDIGGGGALARIEKGRKVMRERKSEWSQADELPIEIPLPPENRYHSIFACPVSKEQSTEANPPMMMACGHVITKESLQKLSKPGGIAPELIALSAEEIDFIDEVISRAPATASTFLTVFKSYNDVLQERGLDPQNEVVYYGKLLKIGTLKGKNWADKWSMVKEQQGCVPKASTSTRGGRTTRVPRTTPTPARAPTIPAAHTPYADTFTLHSHQDDTADERIPRPARGRTPDSILHEDTPRPIRRFHSPATVASTNSLGLDTGPPSSISRAGDALHRLAARARTAAVPRWDAETTAETTTQASSVPPSYGAAIREEPIPANEKGKGKERASDALSAVRRLTAYEMPSPPAAPVKPPPRQPPIPHQSGRSKDAVDVEDPFEKLKRERDEELADRFRNDRLVERCYDVWKQGYEWIVTTGEQIADARDSLILRRTLQRWRQRTASRRELFLRVGSLSNRRLLKRFFQVWKLKHKERKQVQWREEMRARMKTVRERDELRVKRELWAKWRQIYLSRVSEQQLSRKVTAKFFNRWKSKLKQLDELDAAADHFIYVREEKVLDRYWESWRQAIELRRAEKTLKERVELRIMANTMDRWRRQYHHHRVAERFYDVLVVKHALGRWKGAQSRIRAMENRAVKHAARREDVLVRAIMRIWKAHERGKLLTRVRSLCIIKQTWSLWKRRMEEQREREELAQLFRTHSSSVLTASALKKWRAVFQSHQNAQSFAVHYHRAQLQYKMLLAWRLQLRAKLRMVKQSKTARKYLLTRRCIHVWRAKLEEKRRLQKLKEFELTVAKRHLDAWRQRAREERIVKLIRQGVNMRLMTDALRHWTTRVADCKFRELETTQNYQRKLVVNAFKKWKAVRKRHVDELSLMESYQDIKREENMRKMFYRWLAAAKKARHKRLQLRAKEEEFKLTVVAGAWDKWRERFLDIRLQPLADAFVKQHQSDLLFRSFAIWHSKSLSLPAVRFHASHVKVKFWQKWRALMPQALQAKAAREMDRRNTLKKAFARWRKAQQTKLNNKAINYARYLELLSSAPRQPSQPSRGSVLPPRSRNAYPPRRTRPATPTEDEADPPPRRGPLSSASRPSFPRPSPANPARLGIASLLTTTATVRSSSPARKSRSPERPKFSSRRTAPREPSPSETEPEPVRPPSSHGSGIAAWRKDVRPLPPKSAPPSVAGDVPATTAGRSSLWQELKEVRRRSRAPTDSAYSPEPI